MSKKTKPREIKDYGHSYGHDRTNKGIMASTHYSARFFTNQTNAYRSHERAKKTNIQIHICSTSLHPLEGGRGGG